jgi:dTDP-4-dehydrorhamnose reductase
MNNKEKKQTILITGASGFIGGALFKHLNTYSPIGLKCNSQLDKTLIPCDLRDSEQTKLHFDKTRPDIIFHFAALTSPGRNEEAPELAYESHIKITENILNNVPVDTHMIFLSTDKVFDGLELCPNENSVTNPQCIYGRLKLKCETMITGKLKKHHIIRIPIAHTLGAASYSFIDKAIVKLRKGEEAEVFKNIIRCFVYIDDLLKLLKMMINDDHYGIFHIGSKPMSYADRVIQICDRLGVAWQGKLILKEGQASPLSQELNTDKLKRVFKLVAK